MTDAIPEDVMQAARKMVHDHRDRYQAAQDETANTHAWADVDEQFAEDIAAILSEREKSRKRVEELEAEIRGRASGWDGIKRAIIDAEKGQFVTDVLANYRQIRRAVMDLDAALLRKEGTDA